MTRRSRCSTHEAIEKRVLRAMPAVGYHRLGLDWENRKRVAGSVRLEAGIVRRGLRHSGVLVPFGLTETEGVK